jgi:hypothetical protein
MSQAILIGGAEHRSSQATSITGLTPEKTKPMKSLYIHILAGLLSSAAFVQAQISTFTTYGSPNGANLIAGVISPQSSIVDVGTNGSPSYNNLPQWSGAPSNYRTLAPNTGGTVLVPNGNYISITGVNPSSPFTNISVRVPISGNETDSEGNVITEGQGAQITFTLTETRTVELNLIGYNGLAPYGVVGAASPYAYLYNSGFGYITGVNGETSTTTTLSAGTYYVLINADDNTAAGEIVAAINVQ